MSAHTHVRHLHFSVPFSTLLNQFSPNKVTIDLELATSAWECDVSWNIYHNYTEVVIAHQGKILQGHWVSMAHSTTSGVHSQTVCRL